jgi:hypothetical protein
MMFVIRIVRRKRKSQPNVEVVGRRLQHGSTDMNGNKTLARVAGVAALAAAVAQVADFVVLIAVGGEGLSHVFTDPLSLLRAGPRAAMALHWSALLSMLGYELLLAPLALHLRAQLRPASSDDTGMVDLYTFCGLAYIVIAAMGAAMMAVVHPYLMEDYAGASPPRREAIEVTLLAFHNGIAYGLWNSLQTIPVGVWLLGMGSLLVRKQRALGAFTMVLGALALIIWVTAALDMRDVPFLTFWAMLLTIWTVWAGISALRGQPDAARR